jgi:predicted Zn-dependent protease
MVLALSNLKLVRVGRSVSVETAETLGERILAAFSGAIATCELVDLDSPPVDRFDAALLTRVLEEEVGGHVLGVTAADLVDESGVDFWNFLFGGKDRRNDVAVVSTRRLAGNDPEHTTARLAKVSLHEIGHNFGLLHHYGFQRADGGGCCPMSKSDFNRYGEVSYLRSVVDARGYLFCDACRRFLRLVGNDSHAC